MAAKKIGRLSFLWSPKNNSVTITRGGTNLITFSFSQKTSADEV
jgi:hypothetical protein